MESMCGITALVRRGNSIDKNEFKRLTRLLYRRGPDDEGFYFDNNIAFGHTRLSIVDSKSGKQPILNEDETVVVIFNGEIYDYRDITRYLEERGHIFKTSTDTEVLVHLFEEHGYTLSKYLEGMFAFAIYDKKKRSLIISRDHFGKKPLFYYLNDNIFAVASEMKVLLQLAEIKKDLRVDRNSLLKYLMYGYVPSPFTILDGIKKLEPSTTLEFRIDSWDIVNKYRYWDLPIKDQKFDGLTEEGILEKVNYLIVQATKKRVSSDVPLGVFLSGGVDSSLVCALTKQFRGDAESFTVSYLENRIDESRYAKIVAEHIGLRSNFCYLKDEEVLNVFKEILDYLDEPMADAAIIPGYFLSKIAKKSVKIVVSGDGGDEIFGGYPKYRAQKIAEILNQIPFLTRALPLIIFLLKRLPLGQRDNYIKFLQVLKYKFGIRNFIWGSGGFLPEEVCKLVGVGNLDLNSIFKEALDYEDHFRQEDTVNKALYLDCKIQLPDWYLMKTDRMSMAASLEYRSPLLDKSLAEFLFTIPSEYKVKLRDSKCLLKSIASRYVPKKAIYRQKQGFRVPLDIWLRTVLKDFVEEFLNSRECERYFSRNYVLQLWKRHLECKEDNSFKILRIFNFIYFVSKLGISD